jgi:hypothetical protein
MTISVTPIPRLIDLAVPGFTLGTANAAGTAKTAVASDSTLLAFDTTLPAATGTAAVGTATTAPRRDHVHTGTTLAAPALTLGTANSAGAAATAFATNSTLLAFDTSAVDAITFGQSGAVGSATVASRRDHAHAMESLTGAAAVAKVWYSHNAAGVLEDPDFNVASIDDNGTGDRQGNFTVAFSSANYTVSGLAPNSTTAAKWNNRGTGYLQTLAYSDFFSTLADRTLCQAIFGDQ